MPLETTFIKFPGQNVKGYADNVAKQIIAPDTIRSGTSSTDPLIPNTKNKKWLLYGPDVFAGNGGKRKQNRSIKKRQSKRRRGGTKRKR